MRLAAIALAASLAGVGPLAAKYDVDDNTMATSCEAFLSALGPEVHQEMLDALVHRLSASPHADRFGSDCNINDYVTVMCKAHPKEDLRRAIDRLERAGAAGRLPRIPICGA